MKPNHRPSALPQPISWPRLSAAPDSEESLPLTRFDGLDIAGFIAAFKHSLSRAIGSRVSIRPQHSTQKVEHQTTSWLLMATLSGQSANPSAPRAGTTRTTAGTAASTTAGADKRPTGIHLLATPDLVTLVAELMFGGARATAKDATSVERLPPGAASWSVLTHMFGVGCTRALGAGGIACTLADLPVRAALAGPAAGATCLVFETDIEGASGRLLLVDLDSIPPEPEIAVPPAPDPGTWRQRARARTLAVDLPVSLQLEEMRLSLAEVAAFKPGDVVTIARPRSFSLMAGGRRIGTVPASAISATQRMDQSERQQP